MSHCIFCLSQCPNCRTGPKTGKLIRSGLLVPVGFNAEKVNYTGKISEQKYSEDYL